MFEIPHFDFNWKEIYFKWQRICEEEGIDPEIKQVLNLNIDSRMGDLDIGDYDWIPISSKPSQVGPKKTTYKGYTYFTSNASPASRHTASLLMDNLDNEEAIAGIWVAGCALQLHVDFPPYWRGMHNSHFLDELYRFCGNEVVRQFGAKWSNNSKRIFPQKFFSPALLETIDHVTIPQLVRLAALNAQYYASNWIIVRYSIDGLTVGNYQFEQIRNALETAFNESSPETEGRGQFKESSTKSKIGSQHARSRILVPENNSKEFHEGRRKQTYGSAIERNTTARSVCLAHYGPTCVVCGMNFEKEFGEEFAGIIEVHHIDPISRKDGGHLVDPIEDMVPLCPNCHRMIHRKANGVYLPDELRKLIDRYSK